MGEAVNIYFGDSENCVGSFSVLICLTGERGCCGGWGAEFLTECIVLSIIEVYVYIMFTEIQCVFREKADGTL